MCTILHKQLTYHSESSKNILVSWDDGVLELKKGNSTEIRIEEDATRMSFNLKKSIYYF